MARRILRFLGSRRLLLVFMAMLSMQPLVARSQVLPVTADLVLWLRGEDAVDAGVGDVGTWPDQSGAGNDATQSLAARRPTIVAGAIEAAIASPEANTKIHAALYESLTMVHARAPKPTVKTKARARAAKPVATRQPFAHLTGRDVAEALILGEILLEPRAR